ncbi:hypothetical protein HAPAU_41660 [Halalkalicoccus paucihalophilus]|uniref:Uncharacterized protein n=1 Tax=Halalkalicoccus paucihalophilus TaxID=1008153 RepID=A0A151A9Q0_9EURY|nr:hypothetical protein HAPAU_41660 [Halalkalicoccus paucihalophilus]
MALPDEYPKRERPKNECSHRIMNGEITTHTKIKWKQPLYPHG